MLHIGWRFSKHAGKPGSGHSTTAVHVFSQLPNSRGFKACEMEMSLKSGIPAEMWWWKGWAASLSFIFMVFKTIFISLLLSTGLTRLYLWLG